MINLMPDLTFFVQMGIFIFVLISMRILIFRPILRILVRRKELTEGAQEEAEALDIKTEALVQKYESQMKGAREEGLELKGALTKEGEGEANQLLAQARKELDQEIENQRQALGAEAKEAQLALRKYSRDLSSEMAEKLLGRKVSA